MGAALSFRNEKIRILLFLLIDQHSTPQPAPIHGVSCRLRRELCLGVAELGVRLVVAAIARVVATPVADAGSQARER